MLEVHFRTPLIEERPWYRRNGKIPGFYQNYACTANDSGTARILILNQFNDDNSEFAGNMDATFDDIREMMLEEVQAKFLYDPDVQKHVGNYKEVGVWYRTGRIFYEE